MFRSGHNIVICSQGNTIKNNKSPLFLMSLISKTEYVKTAWNDMQKWKSTRTQDIIWLILHFFFLQGSQKPMRVQIIDNYLSHLGHTERYFTVTQFLCEGLSSLGFFVWAHNLLFSSFFTATPQSPHPHLLRFLNAGATQSPFSAFFSSFYNLYLQGTS